jgi:hypothetical protein
VDRICYQGLAATEYTGKELKQDQEGIDKKSQQRNLSACFLWRYFSFIHLILYGVTACTDAFMPVWM